jgi:hypothetical protein
MCGPAEKGFDVADLYRGPVDVPDQLRQAYFWIVNTAIISPHFTTSNTTKVLPSFQLGDTVSRVRCPPGRATASFVLLPLADLRRSSQMPAHRRSRPRKDDQRDSDGRAGGVLHSRRAAGDPARASRR